MVAVVKNEGGSVGELDVSEGELGIPVGESNVVAGESNVVAGESNVVAGELNVFVGELDFFVGEFDVSGGLLPYLHHPTQEVNGLEGRLDWRAMLTSKSDRAARPS